MSNRLTKGTGLVGSLVADTDITATSDMAARSVTSSSGGMLWTVTSTQTVAHKVAGIAFASVATSEVDSGFDMPDSALVTDVYVKITTASSAGGTMSVGLITTSSGDADGFIVSLGTSTTGLFWPGATITSATSGDTVTGCYRGALMANYSTGTTQDEFGNYTPKAFRTESMLEKSVSYTFNSTSGTAGFIIFEYTEV